MKIIKTICAMCLGIAFNANASSLDEYQIFYINGMLTNEDDANKQVAGLEELMGWTPGTVRPLFNDTRGYSSDLFDVWVESKGEAPISQFWKAGPAITAASTLAGMWARTQTVGISSKGNYLEMLTEIKEAVWSDKKTILIAYSQGNFFYRALYDHLVLQEANNIEECFAGVGIGTPISLPLPGNYRYVTSSMDALIIAARANHGALEPTIDIPMGYNDNLNGHSLLPTYLHYQESRAAIKHHINAQMENLEQTCVTPPKFQIRLFPGLDNEGGDRWNLHNYESETLSGDVTLTSLNLDTGRSLTTEKPISVNANAGSIITTSAQDYGRLEINATVRSFVDPSAVIATALLRHPHRRPCPGPITIERDWYDDPHSAWHDFGGVTGTVYFDFSTVLPHQRLVIKTESGSILVDNNGLGENQIGWGFQYEPSARGEKVHIKVDDHEWYQDGPWTLNVNCPGEGSEPAPGGAVDDGGDNPPELNIQMEHFIEDDEPNGACVSKVWLDGNLVVNERNTISKIFSRSIPIDFGTHVLTHDTDCGCDYSFGCESRLISGTFWLSSTPHDVESLPSSCSFGCPEKTIHVE